MKSVLAPRFRFPTWLVTCVCFVFLLPALACAAGGSGTTSVRAVHHKFVVLLCDPADSTTTPPYDKKFFEKLFTDKTPDLMNVNDFFLDQSFGRADIDGTVVEDWLKTKEWFADPKSTTDPSSLLNLNDRHQMAQACTNSFKSSVNFRDYTSGGIITIWNVPNADSGFHPEPGGKSIEADGGPYAMVSAGLQYAKSVSFFTHEMLHAFGIDHARGPYPDDPEEHPLSQEADLGNTHTFGKAQFEEYGDCWTIMGCGNWTIKADDFSERGPELGAAQRDYFGWLPGDRVRLWDHGTTKVTLAPVNKPTVAGDLLVKIPISPSALGGACCGFYTVEYIEKSGWNANIILPHAVLIHEIRPGDPLHTYLVSRSVYGAWLPNQVFLDTASHVRISIDSYGDAANITLSSGTEGDDGSAKCDPPGRLDGSGVMSAPQLKVESPLDGAHAVTGYPVTLQVSAYDPTISSHPPVADKVPEDRISWTVDGTTLTGSSLTHKFTSPGDKTIQVAAYDSYCVMTTKTVTLHVDPPSISPTVVILQPVDGQEYLVGAPTYSASIQFVGTGSSNIVSYDWLDSGPAGYLGSGDHATAPISLTSTSHNCVVEPHTITLRGKTSSGAVVTATITITLRTDCIR